MLTFSASARITASDAVDSEYFHALARLPEAQNPYRDTQPSWLDPVDDFIYDNTARGMTKEELREKIYAEIRTYHPQGQSKAEMQADEDIAAHNNMSLFGNAFGPRDMVRFYTTATSRHSDSSTHSDSLFNDAKRSCDCWL